MASRPRGPGAVLITWSPLPEAAARGEVLRYRVLLASPAGAAEEVVASLWLEALGLEAGRWPNRLKIKSIARLSVALRWRYDLVLNVESGNKDFLLDVLEEADTTEQCIVRIDEVEDYPIQKPK